MSNEYITGNTKHIKKSAFADFLMHFYVYVVVHRRRHLHQWYREYVLIHAHRFALVLMLLPAEANVIALPNRAPAVRVTAPSGPIAIVMIGSDGYKASNFSRCFKG